MKALVTGASSGIGKEICIYLDSLGYELILVSRDKDKLLEVQNILKNKSKVITLDLSNINNCYKLYNLTSKYDVDILVNNAGFGLHGEFVDSDINKEISMIDLNIKAVHILTKLFLKDFVNKDKGYILNVSSSAAFLSGPLMSTYYSTKSYVYRLTTAIYEELRKKKSNVFISVLCPGPVKTNFNKTANCKFDIKSVDSKYVAKYAIYKMFKKKLVIIPSLYIKVGIFINRFLPIKLSLKIAYNIQDKKR
ncbi:MAG: SDR family oxidoreductase [Bacilli bacterium]|nr:SDR family oxidoreductase [Bacilli bacterium]